MTVGHASSIIHDPYCRDPRPFSSCRCGQNVTCLTCGWGKASYPCACTKPVILAPHKRT